MLANLYTSGQEEILRVSTAQDTQFHDKRGKGGVGGGEGKKTQATGTNIKKTAKMMYIKKKKKKKKN